MFKIDVFEGSHSVPSSDTLSTVFMLEVWGVCELSKNKKMHPAKQNRRGRMKKVLKAYASGFIEVELR